MQIGQVTKCKLNLHFFISSMFTVRSSVKGIPHIMRHAVLILSCYLPRISNIHSRQCHHFGRAYTSLFSAFVFHYVNIRKLSVGKAQQVWNKKKKKTHSQICYENSATFNYIHQTYDYPGGFRLWITAEK